MENYQPCLRVYCQLVAFAECGLVWGFFCCCFCGIFVGLFVLFWFWVGWVGLVVFYFLFPLLAMYFKIKLLGFLHVVCRQHILQSVLTAV